MVLNKKQKLFLFENNYLDSRVLDSLVYENWQNYFIDNFKWVLRKDNMLLLKDIDNEIRYEIQLYFQNADFELLIALERG